MTAALEKQRSDLAGLIPGIIPGSTAGTGADGAQANDKLVQLNNDLTGATNTMAGYTNDINYLKSQLAQAEMIRKQTMADIEYSKAQRINYDTRSVSDLKYAPISLVDTLGNYYTKDQVNTLCGQAQTNQPTNQPTDQPPT